LIDVAISAAPKFFIASISCNAAMGAHVMAAIATEFHQEKQQANDLLLVTEAASYLSISKTTLDIWRCNRRQNIPYIKVGRSVRYRRSDLDTWLESKTVTPCPSSTEGSAA
jgi:excisionase family DNA binding protein